MHFQELKLLYFNLNLTEICSKGELKKGSIGSQNGLVPKRQPIIIYINGSPVYQYIHEYVNTDCKSIIDDQITWNLAWISNYIHHFLWAIVTHP